MIQASALAAVEEDLQRVEQALLGIAQSEHPQLDSLIEKLISAGGKRIRPALVLLAGRFNDYDIERLIPGAAAIELLHTATLIHDDTIDSAVIRRGKATVNSMLPASSTILIGDYIFAQSALFAAKPADPEVVSVFARTLIEICNGELQQMEGNHQFTFSRQEYFRRIYAKTGALFACSMEIGALLSDAPYAHRLALRKYGEKLGQAFQVVDDILDFSSTPDAAGKPVGSDLYQGTATLPTIIYLEQLEVDDRRASIINSALAGDQGTDHDLAVELIRDSDAIEQAFREAQELVNEAKASLLEMPAGGARNALYDLADYVIARNY